VVLFFGKYLKDMSETLVQHMRRCVAQLREDNKHPYDICKGLSDDADVLIRTGQEEAFRRFLTELEELHANCSNETVRTAIENVLLFHIGNLILIAPDPRKLFDCVPTQLRKILNNQIYHSGI
jgi:hypothetical protein